MNAWKVLWGAMMFVMSYSIAVSQESWHTGYWKRALSDEGRVRRCVLVDSDRGLERVLRSVGWENRDERGVPEIDWNGNEAVVVAARSNDDGYPAFYGIVREEGRLVLEYGWEEISGGVHISPNSITQGSSAPSERNALIVALRRGLAADMDLKCRNLGLVN